MVKRLLDIVASGFGLLLLSAMRMDEEEIGRQRG